MIIEGHGHRIEVPDDVIQECLQNYRAAFPNADDELLLFRVKNQLFPVYLQIASNAEYEAKKRDEETRKAARQAKIADLRERLGKELRPAAMKEEALARRLQFQRNVETRLSLMIDKRLNEILQQEGIEF